MAEDSDKANMQQASAVDESDALQEGAVRTPVPIQEEIEAHAAPPKKSIFDIPMMDVPTPGHSYGGYEEVPNQSPDLRFLEGNTPPMPRAAANGGRSIFDIPILDRSTPREQARPTHVGPRSVFDIPILDRGDAFDAFSDSPAPGSIFSGPTFGNPVDPVRHSEPQMEDRPLNSIFDIPFVSADDPAVYADDRPRRGHPQFDRAADDPATRKSIADIPIFLSGDEGEDPTLQRTDPRFEVRTDDQSQQIGHQIRRAALELLAGNPEGLRFSVLANAIASALQVPFNSVLLQIGRLPEVFRGRVLRPERGLYILKDAVVADDPEEPPSIPNTVETLMNLGFEEVAKWVFDDERSDWKMDPNPGFGHKLIADVVDGEVMFVGPPMPYGSQSRKSVSRTHQIREALRGGRDVTLYSLKEPETLEYRGIPVDVAVGLAPVLVARMRPAWNRSIV